MNKVFIISQGLLLHIYVSHLILHIKFNIIVLRHFHRDTTINLTLILRVK